MTIELEQDHDEMRAMALGEQPFKASALYKRLSELPLREVMRLSPGVRLSLGYYLAAKRRREQMKEMA